MNRYFAYGSNMDAEQMKRRCPDAQLQGVGLLADHRLGFTIFSSTRNCGAADVLTEPGGTVYGLVYDLTDADLATLDRAEDTPHSYRRVQLSVELKGTTELMHVYEVVEKKSNLRPSEHYLTLIRNAAHTHGFPETYCRMLDGIITQ